MPTYSTAHQLASQTTVYARATMSLVLQQLQLYNWKNIASALLEFSPCATILYGPNAAGKTNIIEAIHQCTTGVSFKHTPAAACISQGASRCSATATLIDAARTITLACKVEAPTPIVSSENVSTPRAKRTLFANGKPARPYTLSAYAPSIVFTPDDLQCIKQSAKARRDEFDVFAKTITREYQHIYTTYTHCVEQRNTLLKQGISHDVRAAWDESFMRGAATLMYARMRLLERLYTHITDVYRTIAPSETLTYQYVPSWLRLPAHTPLTIQKSAHIPFLPGETPTKDELYTLFSTLQPQVQNLEAQRMQTLLGPQRDDVQFFINGMDARTCASQGQQRSIILAIKIAQVLLTQEIHGFYPILLLDDVMSELDELRRNTIFSLIHNGIQAIITTTNLGYFSPEIQARAKVVDLYDTNTPIKHIS